MSLSDVKIIKIRNNIVDTPYLFYIKEIISFVKSGKVDLSAPSAIGMDTGYLKACSARLEEADEEEIWQEVQTVANAALAEFTAMREKEGEKLKADLLEKVANIEVMVGEIEKLSPETTAAYRQRLTDKLNELLEGQQFDQQRVLTETAIFAEKIAVDEETVRLRSHFRQFRDMVESAEPIGRKLDFLIQEFNRESNTIGSKAQDLKITKLVIDMKSEIEKIREQIQNVE